MSVEAAPALIRRRTLRDILDEAMRLTRENIVRMLPAVALPLSFFALIMSFGQLTMSTGSGGPAGLDDRWSFGLTMTWVFGSFALYLAASAIGNTALLGAAVWQTTGEPRSMGKAWLWAFRPRVLGTTLLLTLVIGVGMMMCIIPGIVAGLVFGLTMVICAAEGRFGAEAMGRSRHLIGHNPGGGVATHPAAKLFVIAFVGYMLTYLASMVVQAPFAIVQQVIMVRSLTDTQAAGGAAFPAAVWWLQVPQTVLGTVTGEAVALYMTFSMTLLYLDLRGTKEGEDLELEMDALGVPPFEAAAEGP